MEPLSGNDYINRENIESQTGVQLPKFYDSKVVDILRRMHASLPGNEAILKALTPNQSGNNSVSVSSFFRGLPTINVSNVGNVYGIDNSTTTTHNLSTSEITAKKPKTDEEKKKEKKASDNHQRKLIGALAVALLGVSSYFIGDTLGRESKSAYQLEDLNELKKFRDDTNAQIQKMDSTKYEIDQNKSGTLNKQIEKLGEIIESDYFKKTKRNQKIDLGLRVALFGAALITLIGAAVAAKPLMVAGVVGTGCAFCAWLVKKGIQSGEKVHFDATIKKLNENIHIILACLNQLQTEEIAEPAFFKKKQNPTQDYEISNPVYWSAKNNLISNPIYSNSQPSAPPGNDWEFPMEDSQYLGQNFSHFPGQNGHRNNYQ